MIALIADTHGMQCKEILVSLKAEKPNIITVAGDFILGHRPRKRGKLLDCSIFDMQLYIVPFLEMCHDIAPTYVSLGNHEAFLRDDDLELVKNIGANLLDNDFQRVNQEKIIGGLSAGHVVNYRQFRDQYYAEHGEIERCPSRKRREPPN